MTATSRRHDLKTIGNRSRNFFTPSVITLAMGILGGLHKERIKIQLYACLCVCIDFKSWLESNPQTVIVTPAHIRGNCWLRFLFLFFSSFFFTHSIYVFINTIPLTYGSPESNQVYLNFMYYLYTYMTLYRLGVPIFFFIFPDSMFSLLFIIIIIMMIIQS